jgi:hypothetical protein
LVRALVVEALEEAIELRLLLQEVLGGGAGGRSRGPQPELQRVTEIVVANLLYVDNSNVWIEGMHVAAAKNGLAPSVWDAQPAKIKTAADLVVQKIGETLTYYAYPSTNWGQIRTNLASTDPANDPLERVVGAFPDGNSALTDYGTSRARNGVSGVIS